MKAMEKMKNLYVALPGPIKFGVQLAAWLLVFALIGKAWATPGGLDGAGCHHPERGVYHCHTGKRVQQGQATREQCKTMPNDGWCTKFRKKEKAGSG